MIMYASVVALLLILRVCTYKKMVVILMSTKLANVYFHKHHGLTWSVDLVATSESLCKYVNQISEDDQRIEINLGDI